MDRVARIREAIELLNGTGRPDLGFMADDAVWYAARPWMEDPVYEGMFEFDGELVTVARSYWSWEEARAAFSS